MYFASITGFCVVLTAALIYWYKKESKLKSSARRDTKLVLTLRQ